MIKKINLLNPILFKIKKQANPYAQVNKKCPNRFVAPYACSEYKVRSTNSYHPLSTSNWSKKLPSY